MADTFGKRHRVNIATAYLKNPKIFHPETAGAIETWKEYEEAKKAQKRFSDQVVPSDEDLSKENTRTKARAKAKRLLRYG